MSNTVTFRNGHNFDLIFRKSYWAPLQMNSRYYWRCGENTTAAHLPAALLAGMKIAGEEQREPLCNCKLLRGHQPTRLLTGCQKCWALTCTHCAKVAIKLWQTDKSRSIHSLGWHHFFSSYWSITKANYRYWRGKGKGSMVWQGCPGSLRHPGTHLSWPGVWQPSPL